ncbi:MAG: hypothetical protein ACLFUS_16770 [Candidatus Sumerlaeia bacterium]
MTWTSFVIALCIVTVVALGLSHRRLRGNWGRLLSVVIAWTPVLWLLEYLATSRGFWTMESVQESMIIITPVENLVFTVVGLIDIVLIYVWIDRWIGRYGRGQ